jgi:mRNA-degrading endonuclease YafQ of YafQ-DinJ toxin-antitoxin module
MKGSQKKIKSKAIKSPELTKMFNVMVGAENPELGIVIPKYIKIYKNNTDVLKLLDKFSLSSSIVSKTFESVYPDAFKQIRDFTAKAIDFMAGLEIEQNDGVITQEELVVINADPSKVMDYLKGLECKYKVHDLGDKYKELKKCYVTQELIMIAKNTKIALKQEQARTGSAKHNLECKENLSDEFIIHADGDSLPLFGFSHLDFKQLWYDEENLTPEHKKYILLFLYIIFTKCMNNIELITSPDIDVEVFSAILIEHIVQLKAKFTDCGDAFKALEDSIDMLKGNFNSYYKEFVISNNPSIIIENFVSDVAVNYKSNIKILRQFDKIGAFFKNKIKTKGVKDEKLSAMLDLLDENLGSMKDNIKEEK